MKGAYAIEIDQIKVRRDGGVYTVHVKVGAQRDKEREIEIKALYLD
jgi:hypothetical protein